MGLRCSRPIIVANGGIVRRDLTSARPDLDFASADQASGLDLGLAGCLDRPAGSAGRFGWDCSGL